MPDCLLARIPKLRPDLIGYQDYYISTEGSNCIRINSNHFRKCIAAASEDQLCSDFQDSSDRAGETNNGIND